MSRLPAIALLLKHTRADAEALLDRHQHDLDEAALLGQPDHRGVSAFRGRLASSNNRLERRRALLRGL